MTNPLIYNTLAILKGGLYVALFWEAYKLVQFTFRNTLLHPAVISKLKILSCIFTALLIVKIALSILMLNGMHFKNIAHSPDSYTNGYIAGQYVGQHVKVLLQNVDLAFAVAFIWLLSFVIKNAILIKEEQELTI